MELVGIAGYASVALGFVFLLLLLLTTRKSTIQRTLLMLATLSSIAWGALLSLQIHFHWSLTPVLASETIRNLFWFLLLGSAFSKATTFKELRTESPLLQQLTLFFIVLSLGEVFYRYLPISASYFLLLGHLVQSLICLWYIEQLFRRSPHHTRWMIKPLCLGLGILFAYDFFLYAEAVLVKRLQFEFWYARGWVALIVVPFILLATRRAKHWSARIYVSRDIVLHSTLLLVAGGYLLLMALVGYYIRFLGQNWGGVFQIVFFSLGGLLLASLFLSESLRRKVKVFITKHFFANKYEYREEWMYLAARLDQDSDDYYSTALTAMLSPFNCSCGAIAILKGQQLVIKATQGCSAENAAQDATLLEMAPLAIAHNWIIDINELNLTPSGYPFELTQVELPVRSELFQLVIPISSSHGLNAVCLLSKPTTVQQVNWEDRDLMRAIGNQLAIYLHLNQTSRALTESKQFDAFNRMSAFLVHDLKNVQAQLSLILSNAEKHKHNPDFIDDAFDTVDSAQQRISKVLTQLSSKKQQVEKRRSFSIEAVLKKVCVARSTQKPHPELSLSQDAELTLDDDRLYAVLNHLVQNAQEATAQDGKVELMYRQNDKFHILEVIDTGQGMSEDFIKNRLFKPFDTTKGNAGMGIGAYDAKQFAEQVGGYLEVFSKVGEGSTFKLCLPIK